MHDYSSQTIGINTSGRMSSGKSVPLLVIFISLTLLNGAYDKQVHCQKKNDISFLAANIFIKCVSRCTPIHAEDRASRFQHTEADSVYVM